MAEELTEQKKLAYRHLLYWATLSIRPLAWLTPTWWQWWSPWYWRQLLRRARCAGATADWLHNLALFSAIQFRGFNEEWFWKEFERLREAFPEMNLQGYREHFERHANPPEAESFGT
jgi:hypothetical protein